MIMNNIEITRGKYSTKPITGSSHNQRHDPVNVHSPKVHPPFQSLIACQPDLVGLNVPLSIETHGGQAHHTFHTHRQRQYRSEHRPSFHAKHAPFTSPLPRPGRQLSVVKGSKSRSLPRLTVNFSLLVGAIAQLVDRGSVPSSDDMTYLDYSDWQEKEVEYSDEFKTDQSASWGFPTIC